jgi:hypothetical protein
MKISRYSTIVILLAILFSIPGINSAQAAPLNGDHFTESGGTGTCTSTSWAITTPVSISFQSSFFYHLEWSVTLNGVLIGASTPPYSPAAPQTVNTSTTGLNNAIWGSVYNVPMPYVYRVHEVYIYDSGPNTGQVWANNYYTVTCSGGVATYVYGLSSTAKGVCPIFTDGRLNNCDPGQTAAVYCQSNGAIEVLAIFNSKGYPAFVATPDEIAKVPAKPSVNTLIKSGNGASLYRLTSGELQVNRAEDGTGKLYRFIFLDCPKP